MAVVSIGKLIKKKDFAPILNGMIRALGTSVIIADPAGTELLATDGACRQTDYPVSLAGEIIGFVNGSEKVAPIAALIGYQAQSELEKRSLASETLNKYKEIALLYDMAEQVSSCLETREVARLVIEQARRVIRLSCVAVLLIDAGSGKMETIANFGCVSPAAGKVELGVGIEGSIWASGRAEIVNDVQADPRFAGGCVEVRSLICAPLKAQDRVVGIIKLGSREPVTYCAEDLKLFTTIASLAAVAIENAGLYEQLKESFYTTVYTLAETIEKRDPYTGNHTKRVMEYSLAIGRTLGLGEDDMTRLQLGAVLHDVGKIGIRDSVLLKESPLTNEEFEQIKMHAVYGHEMLSRISRLSTAIPGVRQHHEKFDGRGYPDALKGEEIDITARIIAVADSYDAMTTDRPYRKGLTIDEAFAELKKHSGTQFDPVVVDAFFASNVLEAYFAANSRGTIFTMID